MTEANRQGLVYTIEIAAPCSIAWESMTGNDKIRFCQQCSLNVYNISAMSADEAAQLLLQKDSAKSLCVRIYRRSDGTVLTKNCPVGLKKVREHCYLLRQSIGAALLWLFSFGSPGQANEAAPLPQKAEQQGLRFLVSPKVNAATARTKTMDRHTMGAVYGDYGPFMADLQNRICAVWQAPKGFDASIRVKIAFKIMTDGSVADLKVTKPCGSPSFDAFAMDTIRRAAPFGSPPGNIQEGINVEFTFDDKLTKTAADKHSE